MHCNMTNTGDKLSVEVDAKELRGDQWFRLEFTMGDSSMAIWLTPEQLGQVEFAVAVAQQEADRAGDEAARIELARKAAEAEAEERKVTSKYSLMLGPALR